MSTRSKYQNIQTSIAATPLPTSLQDIITYYAQTDIKLAYLNKLKDFDFCNRKCLRSSANYTLCQDCQEIFNAEGAVRKILRPYGHSLCEKDYVYHIEDE